MSNVRFNEKELISYATAISDAVAKGPVKKLSKKSRSKYLWIVIKSNLLFIFKSQSEPSLSDQAHSCYVLESCYPELTEIGFRIVFNDSSRPCLLTFICQTEQAVFWVRTVKESNFRYLRNCLTYYESLLAKFDNEDNIGVDGTKLPERVSLIFRLQGIHLQVSECHIQLQVSDQSGSIVFKTSSKIYNPNEIIFQETLLLSLSNYAENYTLLIKRTSLAAKQPCFVNVYSTSFCPINSVSTKQICPLLIQIEEPNISGLVTVVFIAVDKALQAVSMKSHNRSSCLFSESIQPLPMDEKDSLFDTIFTNDHETMLLLNPSLAISGAPVNLLHEAILKLEKISDMTAQYLELITSYDNSTLQLIQNFVSYNVLIGNIKNLQFRIEVNKQHQDYLQNQFYTLKRHKSLKRLGYQTLYLPSNLVSYRAKIMDSSCDHYEIFQKTILSTPTKQIDSLKEGGLYSMLCDSNIKGAFLLCKKLTQLKDKMSSYSGTLNCHLTGIAHSLANNNLDNFARSFKDFEATSHSLISMCANAEVADIVIEFAVALGGDNKSPLYVWLNDRIHYIDFSWSVAANLRDLIGQIESLSEMCQQFIQDYRSDMWVELLFLPCNKFIRDLLSLVNVSQASLSYKIHIAQNVSSAVNRFVMRSDAVVCQLIIAVISTIYSSIYSYMDDVYFWLQLLNVGFFIQIESLLSCRPKERVLLEDIYVASELLKSCKIEIICLDEDQTIPTFRGSRYNLIISLPVSTKVYALLLDVCQGYCNRKLNILPVFCNQILDKSAATSLSDVELGFITAINTNSILYAQKIMNSNKIFYNSIENPEKVNMIHDMINELKGLASSVTQPSVTLPLFQKLGKLLCAGLFGPIITFISLTSVQFLTNLYYRTNHDMCQRP